MMRDLCRRAAYGLLLGGATTTYAQSPSSAHDARNEIGLVLGATETPAVSLQNGGRIHLNSSVAAGAEYDRRLLGKRYALYAGVSFLASPFDVKVSLPPPNISPEYASLFLTPHLKLKFHADGAWQPWLVFGGGYANFSPAEPRTGGPTLAGDGSTGVMEFGGGLDTKPLLQLKNIPLIGVLPVSGRLEVRDFYSGQPKYGVTTSGSFQNNVALTAGFVLHF